MLSSTRPPGGVTRHRCRWVDVLSSRYAMTGRIGSYLLRDDEGRAPQQLATGDSKEYYRCRVQRAEPRESGRLTRYAIGTTARPHLGDSPLGPYWDGSPGQGHSALDPPGNSTLRGEWACAAVRCAGGLGGGRKLADHAERRDVILSCSGSMQTYHRRNWGHCAGPTIVAVSCERRKFEYLPLIPAREE